MRLVLTTKSTAPTRAGTTEASEAACVCLKLALLEGGGITVAQVGRVRGGHALLEDVGMNRFGELHVGRTQLVSHASPSTQSMHCALV